MTRSRSAPELVYFEDRGSVFDAPIDVLWDYILTDREFHPKAHRGSLRNMKWKDISEITGEGSCEVVRGGKWTRIEFRATNIRPLVRINEEFAGRYAGLKMVLLYTPKGRRTAVDVFVLAPKEVAEEIRETLARTFDEDVSALRQFLHSRRSVGARSNGHQAAENTEEGSEP